MNGFGGSDLVMETWRVSCAVETEFLDYYLQEFLGINCDQFFVHVITSPIQLSDVFAVCTHTAK